MFDTYPFLLVSSFQRLKGEMLINEFVSVLTFRIIKIKNKLVNLISRKIFV